jgi:hypothetical protein
MLEDDFSDMEEDSPGRSSTLKRKVPRPRRGFSATWKRTFRYLEEDFPIPGRIISDTWKRIFQYGERMFLYLKEGVPLLGEDVHCSST